MSKITYKDINFSISGLSIIEQANIIIEEYAAQGFNLTLRQCFYQFVSRGLIANKQSEYKRIGSIINDARLAGFIDWDKIEDRTRSLEKLSHWKNPSDIIEAAVNGYRLDRWANQPYRVEVWIEKDALTGVIEDVCNENDVPFFSCRGYVSQSSMWRAAQRFIKYEEDFAQEVILLHFGDHDPSGIDMTRDITDRLNVFEVKNCRVIRIALTEDQVSEYNPPPNPAKITDSRSRSYIDDYGEDSWELDALEPVVIVDLIRTNIMRFMDQKLWDKMVRKETADRNKLKKMAKVLKI